MAGLSRVRQGSIGCCQRNEIRIGTSNRWLVCSQVKRYFALAAKIFCRKASGYVMLYIMAYYLALAIANLPDGKTAFHWAATSCIRFLLRAASKTEISLMEPLKYSILSITLPEFLVLAPIKK